MRKTMLDHIRRDLSQLRNPEKAKKWLKVLNKQGIIEYASMGGGKGKPSVFRICQKIRSPEMTFLPPVKDLIGGFPCPEEYFYDPVTGKRGIKDDEKKLPHPLDFPEPCFTFLVDFSDVCVFSLLFEPAI